MKTVVRPCTFSLIAILLLTCISCIHLEQEILITGSNSGAFKINFAVPINLYHTLVNDAKGRSGSGILSTYLDPKLGSEFYSEKSGLKLSQYRVYERGSNLNVLIEGEIFDLQKACISKTLGDFSLLKVDDGTRLLKVNFDSVTAALQDIITEDFDKPREELKELVAGIKLSLTIKVTTEIISTSAPIKDEDVAQWVFDPEVDDQFLFTPPELYVEYK